MNILHICVTSKWFNIDNKGNAANLLI
ncbi:MULTISPECIES: tryptophanase leader peptide [Enterobacteriaceae]|uniref:Tryptophanase leader peptide n=1 Tax=Shigella dysenteriae TaxID=622 RepID=A0A2S8D7E5_SHIDY|nr:tryptophanase leader peptide [Shigella boydii]EFY9719237.1 tryptophanase leader peptide [Shigella sonnei]EFZ0039785.1 tryptophanase leader peptide [Shigella dysenteriae]MBC3914670.1 tryptophanase leader peptide [Shigella flexneri]ODG71254.1 tryptophanase leader peptide [Shigella sp. FC1661]ODG88108.1 tryptophanase leader peptide [Shigella sp. FC1882]ODG89154.1 tryptophanase leader peptide [Shigella sp. FC1764]ODJ32230.1 tryptophanase leader peptide [Shigella sp. FC2383]ODJ34231.1 tryptop